MDKELRKLVKLLRSQGYEVDRTKGGHYLVTKGGQRVTTFAGSASDWRSMLNAKAAIKRYERNQ